MKRIWIVCMLLLFCLTSCAPSMELPDDLPMRIIFFDVGQGDSILIRTPEGDILIDAGPESSQNDLCRKLKSAKVEEIKLAVFTHPDEDHIGGADGVLNQFSVKEIWLPAGDSDEEGYLRLLKLAGEKEIPIDRVSLGDFFRLGEVNLTVFSPMSGDERESNENSIVIKLLCGRASALFAGDAGIAVEDNLLEKYKLHMDVDLYKVAHHGSSSSSSEAFLEAMSPTWAVIGCGRNNAYGHPHGLVLERLDRIGATVFRTDRDGDILFDCDGITFTPVEK